MPSGMLLGPWAEGHFDAVLRSGRREAMITIAATASVWYRGHCHLGVLGVA